MLVLYLDHNVAGRKLVQALQEAGVQAEEHRKHFAIDAPDVEWMAEVGDGQGLRGGLVFLPVHRGGGHGYEEELGVAGRIAVERA